MRARSRWNLVRYIARAIGRAILAWYCGVRASLDEWWGNNIVAPEPRVVIYPRRGPASYGQCAEFRVVLAPAVPLAEAVDRYLRLIEYTMPHPAI